VEHKIYYFLIRLEPDQLKRHKFYSNLDNLQIWNGSKAQLYSNLTIYLELGSRSKN
jgi:hypothetical protein